MHPIEFSHVSKRYRIGAQHDSLRDSLVGFVKALTGRNGHATREGEFWALHDVTLHVAKGETLGIIGPNGAGKSTILKLLSRITTPTTGTLCVRGRFAALIELGGGFHQDLTGAENIYLQGTMLGMRKREIDRVYDDIVAFSELDQFLQTPVKRYSSGMVVRLGFAIAAQIQPEVLLIDEVLAVGDLAFQQKCFQRIAELKAVGTTMIFISHNLDAVQKLCDRVLLLQRGQVLGEGQPAEMIRRYREDVLTNTLKTAAADAIANGGPIAIQQVTLRHVDGAAADALETGEPLRIEIGYHTKRPIQHPSFRVSIERLDGLLCHATASRDQGVAPPAMSGDGVVTLEYPALNLLPNLYQVIVEVFEGTNPIPLAAVRQRCFFQIISDHHTQGAVHLEHVWQLEPLAMRDSVRP